jgi:hypothetical protein
MLILKFVQGDSEFFYMGYEMLVVENVIKLLIRNFIKIDAEVHTGI